MKALYFSIVSHISFTSQMRILLSTESKQFVKDDTIISHDILLKPTKTYKSRNWGKEE